MLAGAEHADCKEQGWTPARLQYAHIRRSVLAEHRQVLGLTTQAMAAGCPVLAPAIWAVAVGSGIAVYKSDCMPGMGSACSHSAKFSKHVGSWQAMPGLKSSGLAGAQQVIWHCWCLESDYQA